TVEHPCGTVTAATRRPTRNRPLWRLLVWLLHLLAFWSMPLQITQDVCACVQDIPLTRHPVKAPQRVRVATGVHDGRAALHDVDVDIGQCSHDLLRSLECQAPVEY